MPQGDTKARILNAALDLFSVNGYEGVSVKQIAAAVGIKDSSLYKHFASKREIFDTLLASTNDRFARTVAHYQLSQGEMARQARLYGQRDLRWLKKACKAIFLFFLRDPTASKFRRMLMLEQYKSPPAARLFRSWFTGDALRFQGDLFAEMMRQGLFRQADPQIVALQFYAPFFLLLCQCDTAPQQEAQALQALMQHIDQFTGLYRTESEAQPCSSTP